MPNTAVDTAPQTSDWSALLTQATALLTRLENILPQPVTAPDWAQHTAFRWRKQGTQGHIIAVQHPQLVDIQRLNGVDHQKQRILRNTTQFAAGHPANNVLLTGARGTGKSSLIKAMLPLFAAQGLRMIEVDKTLLVDLADIIDQLTGRPERFIVFCDDLSFEQDDASYMALKVALEGSLAAMPNNMLIYATSNRRHLMPEPQQDILSADMHSNETIEEKTALSDRFGLWLSFYAFDQDTYLACVAQWLDELGFQSHDPLQLRREALQWALTRGNRSGRTAWQFARDFAGKQLKEFG